MSMEHEWGPWIEHDGTGVPREVPGKFIEVHCAHPNGAVDRDAFWHPVEFDIDWTRCWCSGGISIHNGKHLVIILRYRIRRPRFTEWLEQVTRDLPIEVAAE